MTRHSYTKLFRNKKNENLAIKLLNEGFSNEFIGNILGCHRTSVQSFKIKKEREGVVFIEFKGDKIDYIYHTGYKKIKTKRREQEMTERLESWRKNRGKTYSSYREKYDKKMEVPKAEALARAKETIRKAREERARELIKHE